MQKLVGDGGVGCLWEPLNIGTGRGQELTGLILRLAILRLRDREDLDSEQELQ